MRSFHRTEEKTQLTPKSRSREWSCVGKLKKCAGVLCPAPVYSGCSRLKLAPTELYFNKIWFLNQN